MLLDMMPISLQTTIQVDSAMLMMAKLLQMQENISPPEQQIVHLYLTQVKPTNSDHYFVLDVLDPITLITQKQQRKLMLKNLKITFGQNLIYLRFSRSLGYWLIVG
jgi:hypothetical protein